MDHRKPFEDFLLWMIFASFQSSTGYGTFAVPKRVGMSPVQKCHPGPYPQINMCIRWCIVHRVKLSCSSPPVQLLRLEWVYCTFKGYSSNAKLHSPMEAEFISASYGAVKVFAWLEIKKTFDNSFILFCDPRQGWYYSKSEHIWYATCKVQGFLTKDFC